MNQEELSKEIKYLKNELEKYRLTIYKIKRYINSYSPYFLQSQEENNKTIAKIIYDMENEENDSDGE